jgi:hypothetical protein
VEIPERTAFAAIAWPADYHAMSIFPDLDSIASRQLEQGRYVENGAEPVWWCEHEHATPADAFACPLWRVLFRARHGFGWPTP